MINIKKFLKLSLLTFIFVSAPIFAIIFEKVEKYPPEMTIEEMKQVEAYKQLTPKEKQKYPATKDAADKLNQIGFTTISNFIYEAHKTDIDIIQNKDTILNKTQEKKIYRRRSNNDPLQPRIDELLEHFIPTLTDLAKKRGELVLKRITKPLIQRNTLLQKLKQIELNYDKPDKKLEGEMVQIHVKRIEQLTKDINLAIQKAIGLDQHLVNYADAVIMPDIFGRTDYFNDFSPGLSKKVWIDIRNPLVN